MTTGRCSDSDVRKSRRMTTAAGQIGQSTGNLYSWAVEGQHALAIEMQHGWQPGGQVGCLPLRTLALGLRDAIGDRNGHCRQKKVGRARIHPRNEICAPHRRGRCNSRDDVGIDKITCHRPASRIGVRFRSAKSSISSGADIRSRPRTKVRAIIAPNRRNLAHPPPACRAG